MNKIIEQFNKLNDQVRYGIFGGVVFLVIVLDVIFLALPQMAAISDINGQIKELSDNTQQVLTDKQRLKQLKKNLEDARGQLATLSGKIRPIQEIPAILSTVSSIAREYGVKIDQLVPEYAQKEALTASGDDRYFSVPVAVKVRCGYHMFGKFLNKLENEDLFFILSDFIVQSDDKDPKAHSFSLTIKIILVDRTPVPAPAKK